jgi:hypothetical protein
VSGADDVDHVEVTLFNEAVPVDVEEVETGRRAPVSEEARLDIIEGKGTFKEWIVFEVNLADGEVVSGAPVGVDSLELIGGEGALVCSFGLFSFGGSGARSHGGTSRGKWSDRLRLAARC